MKKTSFILAILTLFAFNTAVFAVSPIEQSIDKYTQEIQNNPQASLAYSNRASFRFLNNDTEGAIQDFDKAIQLNPNNPELYLNRGYIKQLLRDYDGAMQDYNSALKINSKFAFAYNNRGVLKVAMNDVEGAMKDYEQALAILEANPNSAPANIVECLRYLGYYYVVKEEYESSMPYWNKVLEISPDDAAAKQVMEFVTNATK